MDGVFEGIRVMVPIIFLVTEGFRDLIKHQISMASVIITGGVGLILWILHRENAVGILGGILIGLILMLLAKFTEEKIGYGDGWVFVVTGIYIGFRANLYLLFLSLFFSAIISMILLICKKAKRKTELPFVPFMVPAYLLLLVIR